MILRTSGILIRDTHPEAHLGQGTWSRKQYFQLSEKLKFLVAMNPTNIYIYTHIMKYTSISCNRTIVFYIRYYPSVDCG